MLIMNKIVYCSGPMFSPEEKYSMANIAAILESTGYQTYLPRRTADDGAIVEVSTAYTSGKPIVIYKEDPRSELNGYDNPMLSGLSYTWAYVDSISKITDVLKKISDEIEKSGVNPYINSKPPKVQTLIEVGKEIWDILQVIRIFETKDEDLLYIIKKFIEALEGSEKFKSLI